MSFILDALRKSEERRQNAGSPNSGRRVLSFPGQPRSGRSMPWVWLVLLLIPAALLIGWWLGRTPGVETPPEASQPPSETALPTPLEQPPQKASPARQPTPVAQSAPIPARIAAQPVVAPVPAPSTTPEEATASPQKPRAAAPPSANTAESAAEPVIVNYGDLSPPARARLPELEMSLHFYSPDPARRIVRLNGQLLHEGESLPSGPRVQQITETAAILSAEGATFRIESRQ